VSLASRIAEALAGLKAGNAMPYLTWHEASDNLLNMVRDETYQYGLVAKLVAS
jgi:hypothetical protein